MGIYICEITYLCFFNQMSINFILLLYFTSLNVSYALLNVNLSKVAKYKY